MLSACSITSLCESHGEANKRQCLSSTSLVGSWVYKSEDRFKMLFSSECSLNMCYRNVPLIASSFSCEFQQNHSATALFGAVYKSWSVLGFSVPFSKMRKGQLAQKSAGTKNQRNTYKLDSQKRSVS